MKNQNLPPQELAAESAAPTKKQLPRVLFILVIAIAIAVILNAYKPVAEKKVVKEELPFAEYVVAELKTLSIPVFSQGSIKAKTNIKLVAEVSGRVTHMAKIKRNGGFFKKGELLLSLDDTDYQLRMTKAKAQVAAAKQQLIRVETEAGQAKYDLKQIGRDPSKSSSYALREPQLAEARANLQAAQADFKIAKLQMQRTQIKAPFDGRVISKQVDIGQYVSTGTLLADIYSTESVVVRLPLRMNQAELLGLKLRNDQLQIHAIKINLSSSSISSKTYWWSAILSHVEGEVDIRNRLIYLVAEINSPYSSDSQFLNRPPLTPGMFVKAELNGIEKNSIQLPRSVLRSGGRIWVIDENSQLQIKTIELLAKDQKYIYVKSGLNHGDKVITSSIDYPLNGMQVSPIIESHLLPVPTELNHE